MHFKKEVRFTDVNLHVGIRFKDCTFFEPVHLLNVTSEGNDAKFGDPYESVVFEGCIFESTLTFEGENTRLSGQIKFLNCSLNAGGIFKDVSSACIDFTQTKIKFQFSAVRLKLSGFLRMDSCEIDSPVHIDQLTAQQLLFLNSSLKWDLHVFNSVVQGQVGFSEGEYGGDVHLWCVKSSVGLSMVGGVYKSAVYVKYEHFQNRIMQGFEEVHLGEAEYKDGIFITGTETLGIDYPKVHTLSIKCSPKLQGDITISQLDIKTLYLQGISSKANFKIEHCWVNKLSIRYFFNYGQFIISGLRSSISTWPVEDGFRTNDDSVVYLISSNLGKAQIFQTDFESFSKLHIRSAIVSEITTSNVKWFSPTKLRKSESIDSWMNDYRKAEHRTDEQHARNLESIIVGHLQAIRELYRQLKFAMEKQGDIPQSLEFQRWEMEYYREYLSLSSAKNSNDRLILWAGKSNDYGQNWIKAFGLLMLFSFVLYIPIAICGSPALNPLQFADSVDDVKTTFNEVFFIQLKMWPQLLDPTHVLSRVVPTLDHSPGVIFFFDVLHRIATSFFIFQIIAAFRKYVRSK